MSLVKIYIKLPGEEAEYSPIREFERIDVKYYPCPFRQSRFEPVNPSIEPHKDDIVWLENVKQFIWSLGL